MHIVWLPDLHFAGLRQDLHEQQGWDGMMNKRKTTKKAVVESDT